MSFVDSVMSWLETLNASPWIYAGLFGISLLDAMLPVIPSEAPIIMAAVYAASTGHPNVLLVVAAAAAGALVGDHCNYALGRFFGSRIVGRLRPDTKRGRSVGHITHLLHERGGMTLLVARFIPWGRIVATMLMGSTRYPVRSFAPFDAIACLVWAVHGTAIGYIGGKAFEDQPLAGLALGMGLALAFAAVNEWVQRRLKQRRRRAAEARGETLPEDTVTPEAALAFAQGRAPYPGSASSERPRRGHADSRPGARDARHGGRARRGARAGEGDEHDYDREYDRDHDSGSGADERPEALDTV